MKIFDKFLEYKQLPYIIAGLIFVCSLAFLHTNKIQEEQAEQLYRAMLFGHMMAQSSDDLTNNARYYVATKNPKWRENFENVLRVRAGELPDKDGRRKSYVDRVKEINFKSNELELYEKAVKLSNNLAVRETEAFKIILEMREGKIKASDENESQAIDLVFGKDYQRYKAEIMDTSEQFEQMVKARLDAEASFMQKIEWGMITGINISLLILVMVLKHAEAANAKPARRAPVKKKPTRRKPAARKPV